jgi:PTH1 family peptidyl-tRNA hydrolase
MSILESGLKPAKFVVGLGNFGSQYERTKHNAGFWAVSQLATENASEFEPCEQLQADLAIVDFNGVETLLVKPNTGIAGMNSSGIAVKAVLDYFKISPTPESLLVAYDEIEFAGLKVNLVSKKSRLHHNGVSSVVEHLGQETRFARLRIAVGPPPVNRDYKTFALTEQTGDTFELFRENCNLAATAIRCWLNEGMDRAANKVNNGL